MRASRASSRSAPWSMRETKSIGMMVLATAARLAAVFRGCSTTSPDHGSSSPRNSPDLPARVAADGARRCYGCDVDVPGRVHHAGRRVGWLLGHRCTHEHYADDVDSDVHGDALHYRDCGWWCGR